MTGSESEANSLALSDQAATRKEASLLPDHAEQSKDVLTHDLARVLVGVAAPNQALGDVRKVAGAFDPLGVPQRQPERMDHGVLALPHHEPVEPLVGLVLREVEAERDVIDPGDPDPVVDHLQKILERRLVLARE